MSEMGELFDEWREAKREKKLDNRASSTEILRQRGIAFTSNSGGIHLVVTGNNKTIDFWPSTGKYIMRNGSAGRGVFNMIRLINK